MEVFARENSWKIPPSLTPVSGAILIWRGHHPKANEMLWWEEGKWNIWIPKLTENWSEVSKIKGWYPRQILFSLINISSTDCIRSPRNLSSWLQRKIRFYVPTVFVIKQKTGDTSVLFMLFGSFSWRVKELTCHRVGSCPQIKEHQTESIIKSLALGWRQRKLYRKCSPGKSS